MKKVFYLLPISFIIGLGLLMSSCTKQYNQIQPNQTVYASLKTTDWTTADTTNDYTAIIYPPRGTSFDVNGGLLVYFSYDGGKSYEQVPEVYQNVSYSYIYAGDGIQITAQAADGSKLTTPPPATDVKIVLVDSQ